MLRAPASNDPFGDRLLPAPVQETVYSVHWSHITSPHGIIYIGSGAFGTVRLGWLQERRKCYKRILTSDGEKTRTTVFLGACAAVAVKRVMIPRANDGSCNYRRLLLVRELQVMERIRMYPHPNIVQCWGFLFGKEEKEQNFESWNPSGDGTENSTDGKVLTSLNKEGDRMASNDENNDGDERTDQQILEGASYVDLCLSLCTGGTLRNYVALKASEVPHAATAGTECSLSQSQMENVAMASEKVSFDHFSGAQGITGSTNEDTSPYGCEDYGAYQSNTKQILGEGKKIANVSSNLSHASVSISAHLAVPERDVVAIVYALVHALRHTHETLKTLHRDIKPSNVLIFSGVGKTPEYSLQPSSLPITASCGEPSQERNTTFSSQAEPLSLRVDSEIRTLGDSDEMVEFALFPQCPANTHGSTRALRQSAGGNFATSTATAGGVSKPNDEPPTTLVVPLGLGHYRLPCASTDPSRRVYIDCLPQAEGWRIQLADFGVTTGVDQLAGSGRCGTAPFMAPEVARHANQGVHEQYTTKADIYSLGVTLQHTILHLVIEGEEGIQRTCRYADALGAQWIDEDDTATQSRLAFGTGLESNSTETDVKPNFIVPNAWRCDKELVEGEYIRCGSLETECSKHGVDDDKEHESKPKGFVVPRAWRCRDELLERQYIRRELSSRRNDADIHAHLLTPLPNEQNDFKENSAARERRGSRCSSCGKIHRNLIELLNAMTAKKSSQRPNLSTVLQSAAIIERGTFLDKGRQFRYPNNAVWEVGAEDHRNQPAMDPNSLERGAAAQRFSRARRWAEERSRIRSPPTGFRFDMTEPRQKSSQEKNCGGGEDDTTVLLWRPPSLSFLRASRHKMEAHNR
ncbi:protein kinase, putative [Trypanosoma cruzi marinkellei]|uniref:mitogen-activated protein kinase kinase n=1 Tax=Trypanosoma cruzi marinkellei TaxID=85056 RepID=K2MWJ2_TRYCR|nr:protein kinase, putative [Trypanosoma cruzi marinkellei]